MKLTVMNKSETYASKIVDETQNFIQRKFAHSKSHITVQNSFVNSFV